MSDAQWLTKFQSYLALPNRDLATPEESLACEQFLRMCLAVISASIPRARTARAVSEDIRQEVLIKLLEGLPEFKLDPDRGNLESWVRTIASHEAWRWVRKRSKRRERPLDAGTADHVLDPEPGPDVELERMQEHERFQKRVAEFAGRLRDRDRKIVVMRFLDHRSLPEIARN